MHEQQLLDRVAGKACDIVLPSILVLYDGNIVRPRSWQVNIVIVYEGSIYPRHYGGEMYSFFRDIALHRAKAAFTHNPRPVYSVPQGCTALYPSDHPGSDIYHGVAVGVASSDPSKDQLVAQFVSHATYHFMSAQVQAILDQARVSS